MSKITKRFVDSLEPTEKDVNYFDSELKGFGVRVKPSGTKSFFIQYRNKFGRTRKLTLIKPDGTTITATQARNRAAEHLRAIRLDGADPSQTRNDNLAAPKMRDLYQRYMSEHAIPKKKSSSARSDEQLWNNHILPTFGQMAVAEITRNEVDTLHQKIGKTAPGAANRTLALLSKAFNLSELWNMRADGTNPCRHIERFDENKVERFLNGEELGRLGDALTESESLEHPSAILAIRLLLLTGARRGEILNLAWDEVDFDRGCFVLKESKTGKSKVIKVGAMALELLAGQKRNGAFVCYGASENSPFVGLYRPWKRICKRAKIEDARIHDLRHTFASIGVEQKFGLPMVGKLLGHKQAATTQRYAHIADDPAKHAADRISSEIGSALNGNSAEVVEFKK